MRLPRLLIPTAALILLLVLAVALLQRSSPQPASAAPSQPFGQLAGGRKPLIFDLGVLGQDAGARPGALDEVKALGANAVRVVVSWASVAPKRRPADFRAADPTDPHYDFSDLDAYLREIDSRGLKILLSASSPFPRWAGSSGTSDVADPRPAQFGAFMRALAKRYAGGFDPDGAGKPAKPLPGVSVWSVWNEPNLAVFLAPVYRHGKPYLPGLYRRLFEAAQTSIEAEDPGAPVLIGETAPTGGDSGIDPVPFSRAVLCLDSDLRRVKGCGSGPLKAAGWSTHPYSISTNPPFEPAGNPGFVTMDLLGGLEQVLDGASTAGTTAGLLPVYITEYGIQSVPDPNVGVTLQHQADYLSIAERLAYSDPRVASFAQYLLRDDSPFQVAGQIYGGFESGLRTFDGAPKPAYNALRTPLAVQRVGDRVSLWALVQPARGPTTLSFRYQDPGGAIHILGHFRTDAGGVLTRELPYQPGRRWQVQWTDPQGKTYDGPLTPAYGFGLPAG